MCRGECVIFQLSHHVYPVSVSHSSNDDPGLSASYWAAQTEAPITGRKRALVINETQEVDLGERAWHALLHRGVEVLPDHHEQTRRCDEIGKSIVHALELILPQHRVRLL